MHFIRKSEVDHHWPFVLQKPWACATVELTDNETLTITGGIGVGKLGTYWTDLPKRMKVVAPSGEVVRPSKGKKFLVSTETFNPFHLIMEWDL